MNQLNAVSRTVSNQVNSIVHDDKKLAVLVVLLAMAFFAYKNCQCKNPMDDFKKMLY